MIGRSKVQTLQSLGVMSVQHFKNVFKNTKIINQWSLVRQHLNRRYCFETRKNTREKAK